MCGVPSRRIDVIKEALSRAFCLFLLIAHARALVSAGRYALTSGLTAELAGVCMLLAVAILVFGLRFCGVPLLRLRQNRRALVAICLVLAIIHLDCLDPGLRSTFVSKCVIVLATAPLMVVLPHAVRTFRARRARAASSRRFRLPGPHSHAEAWLDAFHPHCLVLAARLFRLRAPPA